MTAENEPVRDPESPELELEQASAAYERIRPEILSLGDRGLSPVNVDLSLAASCAFARVRVVAAYRHRIALLGDFDLRNADRLADYAMATWYLHVTNLPGAEPCSGLEPEVDPLRIKLLRWVPVLMESGAITRVCLDRIRRSRGIKTKAGDLVALAELYRGSWDQIQTLCQAVTKEELDRASLVGTVVFEAACRREAWAARGPSEATMLVRKSWTLLDRAYTQCRRAITYLRYVEGDYEMLMPSLRTHAGPKRARVKKQPAAEGHEGGETAAISPT